MTEIRKVGVCGAGETIGAGIAIVAARAGFETVAYDVNDDTLTRTAKQTEGFFGKSVERGKTTAQGRDAALVRMSAAPELAAHNEEHLV